MRTTHPILARLLLCLAAALFASTTTATTTANDADDYTLGPVHDAQTEVQLVAEHAAVVPGQTITLGLRMRPDDGWHTYWRNPGGSGAAATLAWDLPEGFEAGEIAWPYPDRYHYFGVVNYGYERQVVLLVDITVPENVPGDTVRLAARADWLTCEEICIPGSAHLAIDLPVAEPGSEPTPHPDFAELLAHARDELPTDPAGEVAAFRDGNRPYLHFSLPTDATPGEVYFYPADSGYMDYASEQHLVSDGDAHTLALPLARQNLPASELPERIRGVLRVDQPGFPHAWAIDVPLASTPPDGAPATSAAATASAPPPIGLAAALLGAFIGGMILNLMPCVFPVLSLKVLGFVQHSHGSRWRARAHGLVYALGVMLSFWVLAAILVALQAAGGDAGWGYQLQNPVFVALMALLIFAVGLNLAGVFDIGIGLMNAAGRAQEHVGSTGYAGSLGTGVLATLLATPCTAPFMGAAVGFALSQSPAIIMLVLSALGLGMAIPYVVLAWFPALTRVLPRPGPWMESFKQLLAFPMFAVAAWLVWLFGNQLAGSEATLVLMIALLALGLGGWLYGRWGAASAAGVRKRLAQGAAVALLAVAIALPVGAVRHDAALAAGTAEALDWQPFSDERVAELRDDGRMVFVDFTADWCLTCQWFERTVLASASVREAFAEHNVALVKADWTNQDEHITQALARFDRRSVPFYVLYPADADAEPIVLGEFITRAQVRDAIAWGAEITARLADAAP